MGADIFFIVKTYVIHTCVHSVYKNI